MPSFDIPCTGWLHCGQQAGHSHTGLFLAWYAPPSRPLHFLATCTRWIGAALAPRARRRRSFQRCAALWADLGGRCQVGCLPPTFATNAVVGFGVILAQVGHAYEVPTRAALPGFGFKLVRLMQLALHAAGSSQVAVFCAALNFRGAEVRQGLVFEFSTYVTAGTGPSCFRQALLAKTEFRKWGFVTKCTLAGGVGFGAGGVSGRLWVAALAAQAFHAETHDLQPSIRLPQIVTRKVTQRLDQPSGGSRLQTCHDRQCVHCPHAVFRS